MSTTEHEPALRLAAPAPLDDEEQAAAAGLEKQQDLHSLCLAWADWCMSRRLYLKPSLPPSLLGRLTSKGSGRPNTGGPDAPNSAELAAFHIAFLAQPEDALDRQVFELHYYRRVRNVKAAAEAVGVSRQHWYRLVADCRQRIYVGQRQILQSNLEAAAQLRSRQA
jgi:hypothetical protein